MTEVNMTAIELIANFADRDLAEDIVEACDGEYCSKVEMTLAVVLGNSIGISEVSSETLDHNLKAYLSVVEFAARHAFMRKQKN